METRKLLFLFAAIALAISVPFVAIHLLAAPDDAPITPLQHLTAAVANYFGPWGVAIVRVVDFPNAGLRSFSWGLAIGMTLLGTALLATAVKVHYRPVQVLLAISWGCFMVVWFGTGLRQIADGLL